MSVFIYNGSIGGLVVVLPPYTHGEKAAYAWANFWALRGGSDVTHDDLRYQTDAIVFLMTLRGHLAS